ncbi:ribosome maturation factor RimM [Metabacillus litoralis]|uniref:ribosome maturation factor RimM n=1 Tax=Metabacillus TaxID=2675233 RepID=UPI000EF6226E|nr:ribosome maturation factor RimM [Metabacillus litoralis]MCM3160478.1 ribosome maturation factor RimM [Metabacillus litoralis]MCM3409063.1 ribosome maturation factor RimM [Metabacillus litoralis]
MAEKWFNVGKIVNTHGIRGEVRVISKTDFAEERYEPGNTLYIFKEGSDEPIEVVVDSHRVHKNFDLLTFEGMSSIQDVEQFKGSLLKVTESQLSELEEGEFYFHEIIGCKMFTDEGEEIGTIREILATGANDVWVVQRKVGKDLLVPYIEDIVRDIDIEEKKIVITPMEGLLD